MSARFDSPKIAVPMSAVVFEGESRFVYVVANEKAEKRKVTLGEQIGDKVIVEEGLKPDEVFVVTGTHKLRDGVAVKEEKLAN